MTKLKELIQELNYNAKDENDILKIFDSIADEIFNNYQLIVNEFIYRILEIEFYFDSNIHEDKSSHQNIKQ